VVADLGSLLGAAGLGGAIGQAIVRLELDSSKYSAELKAQQANTVASANAMGASTSRFSALAQTGLLVAGAAFVAFAASAVNAASDLSESLNKARVVFGDAAHDIIAFSETSAEKFGIAKQSALEMAANFGNLAQSAGIAEQASADMSIALVELAADLASFNNVDPTVALDKLQAGLAGEARPLREFGIFISEGRVQLEAYASGIAEVGTELTDAQKVQARYNIILEDSTKAQGDFARTVGESLPNQIRVLRAEFTDLSAEVGKHLLPAVLDLVKAARELLDAIGPVLEGAFELIADAAQQAADNLSQLVAPLQWLVDQLPQTSEEGEKAGVSILGVAKAVWTLADPVKQIVDPIGRYQEAWREATGATEDAVPVFELLSSAVEDTSSAIASGLFEASAALDDAGEKAANFARLTDEEIKELSDSLKAELPNIVGTITTYKDTFTLSPAELRKITDSWARIAKTIASDLEALAESDLKPAMKAAIAGLPPEMRHAWVEGNKAQRTAIENSIRNTLDFQNVINDTVDDMAEGGRESGKAFAQGIASGINQYVGLAITAAANAVEAAIAAARRAAEAASPSKKMQRLGEDMIEGLIKGLESKADELRDKLAGIIDRASSFRSAVSGGFGSFLDISGAFGLGGADIQSFFASQVSGAQQFAAILKALQAQGASPALLQQIASAGPQAIPFAQQLLQMGPEGIAGISGALSMISQLASSTARGLSDSYFGEKIGEVRGDLHDINAEIRGLRQDVRAIQFSHDGHKTINQIRDGLVRKERRGDQVRA
jgi:hypothetical protein